MIFETERLNIRNLDEEDATAFISLQTDHRVMHYVGGPQSNDVAKADLQTCISAYALRSDIWLIFAVVVKITNRFIGTCACVSSSANDQIEIGFRFLPLTWNQGYATELAPHLIRYARINLKSKKSGRFC